MSQQFQNLWQEPYAYMEISNSNGYVWPNVKEYDVVLHASHPNMSYHLGASSNATSRMSLTSNECMFFNDFFVTNQMVMRGIQLQESPWGDNTPYQVTQQVSDMKGYDPWGEYIKITLSNGQSGFQVLDSQRVPQITLSTTTGRIHANSNDSARDPSYSWSNNSNLGVYHYADNIIGFANLGLDSARLESHGRLVLSNQSMFRPGSNFLSLIPQIASNCNVELRFAAESNLTRPTLTFYDDARNTLHMGKSMSNAFIYTCNNNLDIGTNFQSHLFIDPSGQIGLKTIHPTTHMVIHNGTLPLSNTDLQVQNTSSTLAAGRNALYAAIKHGSTGSAACNYFAFGYRSNVPALTVNNADDPITVHMNGAERMRWNAGNGYLGIFSSNPRYQVDLVGDARLSSNLFLTQTPTGSLAINTETPTTSHIHVEVPPARVYTNPSANAALLANNTGATHSILCMQTNTGNPFVSFNSLNGGGQKGWSMGIDTADAQKFKLASSWDTFTEHRLTVDTAGNVGINTTVPNAKLVIANGGNATGPLGTATRLYLQTLTDPANSGFIGCVKKNSEWIGLGCSGGCNEVKVSNTDALAFTWVNNQKFVMTSTGRLGVNLAISANRITMPAFEIDVIGTIRATTDVLTNSDARLKTDLQTIPDPVDKVSKLTGYTYTRTDVPSEDQHRRFVGLIAQDLQQVLPEAVNQDDQGYLAISYGNLSALLVEAIKDLTTRIARIEDKLNI